MQIRRKIVCNPYRVLGVCVGASPAEELRNKNRITAFAKVGQPVSFTLPGDDLLAPVERNEQTAADAAQALSLPADRVSYALLWFGDGTTAWGRTLSTAVSALIKSDYATAVNAYQRLVGDPGMRNEFLDAATRGLYSLSEQSLSDMVCELISQFETDFIYFWSTAPRLPHGNIAQRLFILTMAGRIDSLIGYIPVRQHPESNADFDLYDAVDTLRIRISLLKLLIKNGAEVMGHNRALISDYRYRTLRALIARCRQLIEETGKCAWNQKHKLSGQYTRYTSDESAEYIAGCMHLIDQIDAIVNDTMSDLGADEHMQTLLSPDIDDYRAKKNAEYVTDRDIIRRAVRSHQYKQCAFIGAWLLLIYLIFF